MRLQGGEFDRIPQAEKDGGVFRLWRSWQSPAAQGLRAIARSPYPTFGEIVTVHSDFLKVIFGKSGDGTGIAWHKLNATKRPDREGCIFNRRSFGEDSI
jgi:hypothetical protein